ncbi:asparaginase [Necator americanus]|uniref:Asparaginase n=1 Tax=Necator americanus TaxID=51031 RepID=W2TJX4_NECAM|nr:asparaginase [Necator americanus]ETN82380.1 asparaginase [Necator americanus]
MIAVHGGDVIFLLLMSWPVICACSGVGFRVDRALSTACAEALRDVECDVVSAVSCLEDDPSFNCGLGSNPTMEGTTECEAGFMSSEGFRFGAVGAVSRLQNPCQIARAVALTKSCEGLISPMVLVGPRAEDWAQRQGFPLCDSSTLCTENTHQMRGRAAHEIDEGPSRTAAKSASSKGASSGGVILKTPGRLGHCTIFGSGMWAERRKNRSIGVSVSGCGEALTRADFCRSLAKKLLDRSEDELPSAIVHSFLESDYVNSAMMATIARDRLCAGGLVLLQEDDHCELIVFHNTPVFPFAYRQGSTVRKRLSELPKNSQILVDSYSC